MSNARAIGSVTRLLKAMLQARAAQQGLAVTVSALPPGPTVEAVPGGELNVHLYRVSPSVQRDASQSRGTGVRAPRMALDLHYLVSARGRREFEAEILLGQAMTVFHETPMIATTLIQSLLPDDPGKLAEQGEIIRIIQEELPLQETLDLWRTLRVDPRLAVAYVVSGLLIEQGVPSSPMRRSTDFPGMPEAALTLSEVHDPAAANLRRRADDHLPRIELGQVSDKYIGETERNLGGVFGRAERSGAALRGEETDDLFEPRPNGDG